MSLPQPPEGILDQSVRYDGLIGWTQTPKSPGLWGNLKARLTGIPNEYGDYSSYVNISEADADKLIENMKKDPRGYPMLDQTSGTPVDWMDRQRRYQEWLVEAYLNSSPINNPENIPVELEIINVEPQKEDDPIVVKVETPLEPVSKQRKRIRLKRIPNTIKKPINKNDVAARMAAAFDKRLDAIIEAIQKPPTPSSANVKPEPKKREVLYRKKYKTSSKSASTFNEYLYNKIGSAFSLAAQARKEASAAGAPKQRAGFFVGKALSNEFGGDFLRRTRGTFSSDPTSSQDPALSKGDRFRSLISPYLEVPKVQQLSLDLDSKKGSGTVSVTQVGLSATIKPVVKNLSDSYKDLFNRISSLKIQKNNSVAKESEGSNLLASLADQMVDLLDSVKDSIGIKKKYVHTKQLTLNLKAEIAREAKAAEVEKRLEGTQQTASLIDSNKAPQSQSGPLGFILSLLQGNNDDDGQDGGSPGGGGGLFDLFDGGDRRRRNPRRGPRRNPRVPTPKPKGPGVFSKFKNFMGGKTAKRILGVGGLAAGAGLVTSALSGMGGGVGGAGKGILNAGKSALGFFGDNPIAKRIAMATGKFGGRMIPAAGTAFSAAEAADRASRGDTTGAWLAGLGAASGATTVATSGAALTGWGALIPLAAEVTSAASDIGLFGYDIFNALTGRDPTAQPKKKMAEGGVMVGEAGPELVANNTLLSLIAGNKSMMGGMPNLGVILGTTSQVIEQVGPAAGAVRPYIENMISPLVKMFGSPTYALTTDVGRGISGIQTPEPKDDMITLVLKKLLNFITGNESDDPEVPITPPPMGQGTDFWTLAAVASMEASDPQHQADVAQSVYNRLADGRFGGSIVEILTRENQYEPAFNAPGTGNGINPLFKSINDVDSAARAVQDGTKRIFNRNISIEQAKKQVEAAAAAIQNPTLQQNAAQFVGPYTDFRGYSTRGAVRRPDGGNYFFSENPSGKLTGAAPIPSMNSASSPATPGNGQTVRAVGDSLAEGVAQNSDGRIQDNATQSMNPSQVNTSLRSAGINRNNTRSVVLSTGLANNPDQRDQVLSQLQFLQQNGIPYTVMPISDQQNADILKRTGKDTNRWLRQVVPAKGGSVSTSYSSGGDGVHPSASTYRRIAGIVSSNN